MQITTIDFETYYDKDYSLSKLTTEAYIRDPRFEVILVGVLTEGSSHVMSPATFTEWAKDIDWSKQTVLCHHTHFDGAILSWKFGIKPGLWLDTLSMARAVLGGYTKYYSLGKLAEIFGLQKGDEVIRAIGKHRKDFSSEEYNAYSNYCINDCKITRELFSYFMVGWRAKFVATMGKFPNTELKLIDRIIRMFTEPTCYLDSYMLQDYYTSLILKREDMLVSIAKELNVTPENVAKEIRSSNKFASLLKERGVIPPTKSSPADPDTQIYAFAKTDKDFITLLEHSDEVVQELVATRLQLKSTLNQTRAKAMLDMSHRGAVPIYYKFSGADQTHRLSGGDKTNFQNLPREGILRNTICAPPGHVVVVVDSSNIEARVVDTLALQNDMVEVYKKNDRGEGRDVYCYMASEYYGRKITKKDKKERQFGKTLKLACGFGMGPDRLVETARTMAKIIITPEEGRQGVQAYRKLHNKVRKLWYRADDCIENMSRGVEMPVDPKNIVYTVKNGFRLPNGMSIKYPYLGMDDMEQWVYTSGRFTSKLYGGKAIENIVQALARIIVMYQCEAVSTKYPEFPWVMSSHDEGVWVVPKDEAEKFLEDAIHIFRTPPDWWPTIPLNAEGGFSTRYGWAKE